MIAIDGIIITEYMHKAGLEMASNLVDALISDSLGTMGGHKIVPVSSYNNSDLVLKALDKEIDSVQAMYLAMRRADGS